MAESKEETIKKLCKKLGRDPTEEEVRAARDAVIRIAYAGMALTDALLRDEVGGTKS
jgi:hypothetical protein